MPSYDAILLVSFGGPERPEDVMPFLENVTRGRNIPRERLLGVAEHYQHFNGRSPINDHCRELIAALEALLAAEGPRLPVYWGNRNWHPLLPDTIARMKADGIRRALAFVTSSFSSYSGCRQYRENIAAARLSVGDDAPEVDKMRVFYNHPGFIEASADRIRDALARLPEEDRAAARLVFTAHSIPESMAATCAYEAQLVEACSLVASRLERLDWALAYQSRSGPPSQPWLEPDINDYLRAEAATGFAGPAVICPIGFLSDHVEVLWDLDHEAKDTCAEAGIRMERAATVGAHPRFVRMIRELILERVEPESTLQLALGPSGLYPQQCSDFCCMPPARPTGARPGPASQS